MNEDTQIKSVALFFFFGLLDEELAKQATLATISKVQKRVEKVALGPEYIESSIVYCTNREWNHFQKIKKRGHSSISYEAGWLLPENISIGLWQEFHKKADPDEFLSVLWAKVLGFSEDKISHGLGVTEGTIRHRIGRGLKFLGSLKEEK